MRFARRPLAWLALSVTAVALVAAGCGDNGDDPLVTTPTEAPMATETPAAETPTATPTEEATATPTAEATATPTEEPAGDAPRTSAIAGFALETFTVPAGTTVRWVNNDDVPHTATADDGEFDSGNLNQGESFEHTFEEAGTFSYFCEVHPAMTATVTVE